METLNVKDFLCLFQIVCFVSFVRFGENAMKENNVKRVRAQRKFALGAFVPAATASNLQIRGIASVPSKYPHVVQHTMSATNFLDFIAFKSVHSHLEPRVMLERLTNGTQNQSRTNPVEDQTPVKPVHAVVVAPSPEPTPILPVCKPKVKVTSKNSTMCLRSRTTVTKPAKQLLLARKRARAISIRQRRERMNLRRQRAGSSSDIDDERPLKFFQSVCGDNESTPKESAAPNTQQIEPTAKKVSANTPMQIESTAKKVSANTPTQIESIAKKVSANTSKQIELTVKKVSANTLKQIVSTVKKVSSNNPIQIESTAKKVSPNTQIQIESTAKNVPANTPMQMESTAENVSVNTSMHTESNAEVFANTPIQLESSAEEVSANAPIRIESSSNQSAAANTQQIELTAEEISEDAPMQMESTPKKSPVKSPSHIESQFKKPAVPVNCRPRRAARESAEPARLRGKTKNLYCGDNEIYQWMKKFKAPPRRPKTQAVGNKIKYNIRTRKRRDVIQPALAKKTKAAAKKRKATSIDETEMSKELPDEVFDGDVESLISNSPCPTEFTVPLDVTEERSQAPCPSESMFTVRDVVSTPQFTLDRRCRKCDYCSSVDKVLQIKSLMPKHRYSANNDVYEFDADGDDASTEEMPSFYYHRKQTQTNATDNDDENCYLLDIFPKSNPRIVQLKSLKVPNQKKSFMSVGLVPKSEAHGAKEIRLVEHDNLLDHIIQSLAMHPSQYAVQSSGDKQNVSQDHGNSGHEQPSTSRCNHHGNKVYERLASSCCNHHRHNSFEQSTARRSQNNSCLHEQSSTNNTHSFHEQPPSQCNRNVHNSAPEKRAAGCSQYKNDSEQLPSTSNRSNQHTKRPRYSNEPGMFPKSMDPPKVVDAPTYVLKEAEFNDPIAFFEKIVPIAAKFGICKLVVPDSFKPKCNLSHELNFEVANHYINRMYSRWGTAAREMCAIKAYLTSQNVKFTRPPLMNGLEMNLAKLYLLVQRNGGLKRVLEKKRWNRVAEEMRLNKGSKTVKCLDRFYVKFLLPYDTLSNKERQSIMWAVEKLWNKKNRKLLEWALNPLHRQKKLLCESDSSEDEDDEEPPNVDAALAEAEDCVVKGRKMNSTSFEKVAAHAMESHFSNAPPSTAEIEKVYWRHVLLGTEHVCVNAASIDTGDGYGFSTNQNDPCSSHPWNLKKLSENSGNVLRSLGAVLGVTVPILHLGMVFSTSCWHRDPHGLPWIEYMHKGPSKIWYGIPNEQSSNFRKAVEALCPTSCQNKSIWLPSDITMIPPNLLCEHNVSLSRVEQNPGEYIIVFPKAYSSSISTGYTVTESVYFATNSWLKSMHEVFQEVRDSCEPTTFSLEQLLIAIARDERSPLSVLQRVHSSLSGIFALEMSNRRALLAMHVKMHERCKPREKPRGAWNVRDQDECEVCRTTLYLSMVTGIIGKNSPLCLQHALRLLEMPRHRSRDMSAFELVVFIPEAELDNIMFQIEERLVC